MKKSIYKYKQKVKYQDGGKLKQVAKDEYEGTIPEVTISATKKKSVKNFFDKYTNNFIDENNTVLGAVLAPITYVAGIPQGAMTYVSSKRGDVAPSKALNIKNPAQAAVADMLLDPTALLGNVVTKGNNLVKLAKTGSVGADIARNLNDLTAAKKWAAQYGYGITGRIEDIAKDNIATDNLIKNLATTHNSFARGVNTNMKQVENYIKANHENKKAQKLIKQIKDTYNNAGIDPYKDSEAAAHYAATHIPFNTGYGRADLAPGKNALYTSNSFETAESYTYGDGYITKLVRPVDFSSKNRIDWLNKNDFMIDQQSTIKKVPYPSGPAAAANFTESTKQNLRNKEITSSNDLAAFAQVFKHKTGNEEFATKIGAQADYFRRIDPVQERANKIRYTNMDIALQIRDKLPFGTLDNDAILADPEKVVNNYAHMLTPAHKKILAAAYTQVNPGELARYQKDMQKYLDFQLPDWKKVLEEKPLKDFFIDLKPYEKYSHYLFSGEEGKKVADVVNISKVTPDKYINTSRAHEGKRSKGLSLGAGVLLTTEKEKTKNEK